MQPSGRRIYLDNASTTRCDEEVARRIYGVLTGSFGNPSSLHQIGLEAEKLVTAAREQVAAALGCEREEIFFTTGATGANNLALFGGARAKRRRGMKLLCNTLEHQSVLAPMAQLENEDFTVTRVEPGRDGLITPESYGDAVDESTTLASCMLLNNETGAVNDIAEITRAARRKNADILIHCDAAQAFGKLPVNVRKLNVDLLTISGHKIYGPKGVGVLYVRRGTRVVPLLFGGGQEGGLCPGTENVAGISGMGLACELAVKNLTPRAHKVEELSDRFLRIIKNTRGVCINSPTGATPYICNLSVIGLRSEVLLHFLEAKGVFVSSASACSGSEKSHVLTALGLDARRVDSAIRVSFSPDLPGEDVDFAGNALVEGAETLMRQR